MTLLFMDGFDAQDITRKWSSTLAGATFAVGRYGSGYSFQTVTAGRPIRAFTASAQVIVGVAFKLTASINANSLMTLYGDNGASDHPVLSIQTSGGLRISRSSTSIANSVAGLINLNTWYYLEFRATIHDTTGVWEVLLNGAQVINFTGDTRNGGTNSTFDAISLSSAGTNTDTALVYDDLYVLNTLGTTNNTFLGEVVVRTLVPTGAGASTGLTPVGAPTNWDNVEEVPPSLTDYNYGTASGARDTYTLANLPVTPTAIYGVQTTVLGSKTDVTAASLKPVLRSAGTNFYDPTLALSVTPTTTSAVRETDPATSVPWTTAGVNALEVGAEVA